MLERPLCPECGDLLSLDTSWDKETDELIISFFCDGDRSDNFSFQIRTGLTQEFVDELWNVNEVIEMKMGVMLDIRDPYPDDDNYDEEE